MNVKEAMERASIITTESLLDNKHLERQMIASALVRHWYNHGPKLLESQAALREQVLKIIAHIGLTGKRPPNEMMTELASRSLDSGEAIAAASEVEGI